MIFKRKDTVQQLLSITNSELLEELKQLVKYAKPSNVILKKKWTGLMKMPFKDAQKCKDLYKESKLIELISFVTQLPHKKILQSDYHGFIYFLSYLNKEFQALNKLEKSLNSTSNEDVDMMEDMKQAGSEELSIFGTLSSIDNLAQGNILEWEKIESLPYERIYTKMLMDKKQSEIQRRYQKIVSEKFKK